MVGLCLVSGAALGVAFELFCRALIHVSRDITCFNTELNSLKSTLDLINLIFLDIQTYTQSLDHSHQEAEAFVIKLTKGEKLIQKCSKVKWNPFKRWHYSKKLKKLEASLRKFFQIDVAAYHLRESKRISVAVSRLEEKVDDLIATIRTPGTNDLKIETSEALLFESAEKVELVDDDDDDDDGGSYWTIVEHSTSYSALEQVAILHIYGS